GVLDLLHGILVDDGDSRANWPLERSCLLAPGGGLDLTHLLFLDPSFGAVHYYEEVIVCLLGEGQNLSPTSSCDDLVTNLNQRRRGCNLDAILLAWHGLL